MMPKIIAKVNDIYFNKFHVEPVVIILSILAFIFSFLQLFSFHTFLIQGVPSGLLPSSISLGDIFLLLALVLALQIERKNKDFLSFILIFAFVLLLWAPRELSPQLINISIAAGRLLAWMVIAHSLKRDFLYVPLAISVLSIPSAIVQTISQHSFISFLEAPISSAVLGIAKFSLTGMKYIRAYGLLQHPNILGGIASVSVLSFSALKFPKHLAIIGISLCSALVGLSISRSGLLSLAIGLMVAAFQLKDEWKRIMVASAIVLLPFIPVFVGRTEAEPQSVGYRTSAVSELFSKINAKTVLLGQGLADSLNRNDINLPFYEFQPAHNSLALAIASIGILPIAVLLLLGLRRNKERNLLFLIYYLPFLPLLLLDHYFLTSPISGIFIGSLLAFHVKSKGVLSSHD